MKLAVGLGDKVHVDQIALMTAEKTVVAEFRLDFSQLFIDDVTTAVAAVEDTLGVGALYERDLGIRYTDDSHPLLYLVRAGIKILKDAATSFSRGPFSMVW